VDDSQGEIHDENPFAIPPEERDPARRFRGRLAAPVTLVTSGRAENRAGLTVSSLVVAEGEPSRVHFLAGSDTDLFAALSETGSFVVHILGERHREASDVFAGLRPNPGGPFAGLEVEDGDFGPVLVDVADRAYCRVVDTAEDTFHVLVSGEVEHVQTSDLTDPLVYFRGAYRRFDDS
jgi:flavin reductase (DIM6/NTAB) family NADH-FMN oxidoreductase RutF